MALNPNALTTVQNVETYGGLVADADTDNRIEALINAMTGRMERECSRKFKARDFTEWYNIAGHQDELVLQNYPIIRAPMISYGEVPCMVVSYSGNAIEATVSSALDRMTTTTYDANGVRTQTDFLYTAYGSVQALCTAISLISGFTATVSVNVPSFRICPMSGFDLLMTTAYVTYPNLALRNPSVNYELGVVANRFWQVNQWVAEPPRGNAYLPPGFQYVLAEYRAGYETIPVDLAMLCNELVMDVYNKSNRDWTVKSEELDQYSYTLVDQMAFNQSIRDRLNRYMRFATGGV